MREPIRVFAVALAALAASCSGNATGSESGPASIAVAHSVITQDVVAGQAVTVRPVVLVTDSMNRPVAGVSVTFAVISGSGTVTGASQTTNASGEATVGAWVAGPTFGAQTLVANALGLPSVTFTATAIAPDSGVQAFDLSDPKGDTLVIAGIVGTVPAIDLIEMRGVFKRDSLVLTLTFTGPVAPAASNVANSIGGLIEIDSDNNAGTGFSPFSNQYGASANVGIDYAIDLFDSDPIEVPIENAASGATTLAPAAYVGNTLTIRLPLSAIGNADGVFALVSVLGVLERPTDIFPNAGQLVVSPAGSSVVGALRNAAPTPSGGSLDTREVAAWRHRPPYTAAAGAKP